MASRTDGGSTTKQRGWNFRQVEKGLTGGEHDGSFFNTSSRIMEMGVGICVAIAAFFLVSTLIISLVILVFPLISQGLQSAGTTVSNPYLAATLVPWSGLLQTLVISLASVVVAVRKLRRTKRAELKA